MTDILTALFLLPVPIMNISVSAPKIPAGCRALRPDEYANQACDLLLGEDGITKPVSSLLWPGPSVQAKHFRSKVLRALPLPAGYRWLNAGEKTQTSDVFVQDDGTTGPVYILGSDFGTHRVARPLESVPPLSQWRQLEPHEIVQQGDKCTSIFYVGMKDALAVGERAGKGTLVRYYRRVEPSNTELAADVLRLKNENVALAKKLEAAELQLGLQRSLTEDNKRIAKNKKQALEARICELETELLVVKNENTLIRQLAFS